MAATTTVTPAGPVLSESFKNRSPSKECFQAYSLHLKSKENFELLREQMQNLIEWNERMLEDLDPRRGKALKKDVIRRIFNMSEKLGVPDLTKLHAIEIYDRFELAFESKMDSVKHYFSGAEKQLLEKRFKGRFLLHVGTCIQLASKSVCCGKNLFSEDVKDLLNKMNQPYELDQINCSELKILSALNFNVSCFTPLEVADILIMLLNLDEDQYRLLYGICIRMIDYVYLMKNKLYAYAGERINSHRVVVMNSEKLVAFENDYVLRAAAAVQCSAFITSPSNPWLYLESLAVFTRKSREDIRTLAGSIAFFLSNPA